MRKTAGQLIREASDGEIMGIFHCRGQPVTSDDLSDAYSRRPFTKVFDAQEKVHEQLKPVFDQDSAAFTLPRSKGSPNLRRSQLEKIKTLRQQGVRPSLIAEMVGVSPQTVYRHR